MPSTPALVLAQTRYALTELARTPVAAFFTIGFPLIWLGAIVLVTGNPVVDPETGRRLAQYLTGPAIAFATVMSCFSSMPVTVALARDRQVLKRLRGTPLPAWAYVAGRVAAAVVVSLLAAVVVLSVSVAAFGVEPVWRTLPATVVTLLVGVVCFAALGLAVVALTPDAKAVQAVTPAVLVSLAFVSGLFVDTDALPVWLRRVGQVLPLEPLSSALGAQLDPYRSGAGWYPGELALLAGWGVVGALVALRWFRWEPRRPRAPRSRSTHEVPGPRLGPVPQAAREPSRPSLGRLLAGQTGYALRELWRDTTSTFFAIGLPVLLLVLVAAISDEGAEQQGMPVTQYLTGAMAAYGVFVTAYATLPATVATAAETGVLKRLRGTPLPFGLYLAGRVLAVFALAVLTLAVLLLVGVALLGVEVEATSLPGVLMTLLLGSGAATALGLVLAAAVRPAKAVPAVALGTLLPLAFVSDVFVLGAAPPQWLQTVASVFPLKHFAVGMAVALDPGGAQVQPGSLVVLAAWAAGASLLAWWLFSRPARGATGAGPGPSVRSQGEPVEAAA